MKATMKFQLRIGKLNLPLECFKAKDETKSVYAQEVCKINGQIHKVQRKPFVVLEDGSEKDIDSTQILKRYEKDDGSYAVFTKSEQTDLFKRGSSKEWVSDTIVDKNVFDEMSFQKQPVIAMVGIDKKKELVNQKNLKFFQMLKEGIGTNKAIICQVLVRNVEYPVAITNYGNQLLVRFLQYSDEMRTIEEQKLQELNEQEKEQARNFITQFLKPDFDINAYENNTTNKVMEIINSRGEDDVADSKINKAVLMEDNPFEV